jgi:hypothetical protein
MYGVACLGVGSDKLMAFFAQKKVKPRNKNKLEPSKNYDKAS